MVEFTFRVDRAAVGKHDVFGDSEAKSSTTGFARAGFVDAIKTFEQAGQMLGGNARAEILYVELNTMLRRPGAQHNAAAGPAVLHRVVDEVREDLVDRFAIGQHGRQGFNCAVAASGAWLQSQYLQLYALAAGDLAEIFFRVM